MNGVGFRFLVRGMPSRFDNSSHVVLFRLTAW